MMMTMVMMIMMMVMMMMVVNMSIIIMIMVVVRNYIQKAYLVFILTDFGDTVLTLSIPTGLENKVFEDADISATRR